MSDTRHHRKPGATRKPGKGHLPNDRTRDHLRDPRKWDTLGSFEPISQRRTR